jgi:hypothetical protein
VRLVSPTDAPGHGLVASREFAGPRGAPPITAPANCNQTIKL